MSSARLFNSHALRRLTHTACATLSVIALPACALTTLAAFWDDRAILGQLSPFRLQYAVLLAAHTLFCLALHRRRLAAVFAVFTLFNLALIAPTAWPAPTAAPDTARALKIVYANVLSDNNDPGPLLALIARESPDLIALVEVDDRWDRDIAQGLGEDYPYRLVQTREDNFGLALYSRRPLSDSSVEWFSDDEFPSLATTMTTDAGDLKLLLTHPPPPGSTQNTRVRNRHIATLSTWARHHLGQTAGVILGDFNATPWCPPMRVLTRQTDLRYASRGHAAYPASWPDNLPHMRIPIDHVLLHGGAQCIRYEVGPKIGSDHFPLIVDLGLSPDTAKTDRIPPPP